jgi:hypothetical protein
MFPLIGAGLQTGESGAQVEYLFQQLLLGGTKPLKRL